MSVSLLPGIAELDPNGTGYRIYSQLYHHFFNAQDKKDESHPWGIVEGDEVSIRLRNTAYGFAEAISGAAGEGGSGGVALLDYLKKTGGDMTGILRANYGFEAGIKNTRIIETYCNETIDEQGEVVSETFGAAITGDLLVGANNLYIGGKQFISYLHQKGTAYISAPTIDFVDSVIRSEGEIFVGRDKETGIYIHPENILVKGNVVYHAGNANLPSVNWTMYNAAVTGAITVGGIATFADVVRACHGVEFGYDDQIYIQIDKGKINIHNDLNFTGNYGILFQEKPVLKGVNGTDIQLSAHAGNLLLGNENTHKIKLFSGITDIDGDYILISKYGAANFPDSLTVRHNYGDVILSSYRKDSSDEGIIIYKKLMFQTNGASLKGRDGGISFASSIEREKAGERQVFQHETLLSYQASTSYYQPLDRFSNSLFVAADVDFFVFNKPVESKTYLGIDQSATRLTDGSLFFTNENYLLSVADGIKHYGNAFFLSNISSERFSSGFAGAGWAILHNKTTGNVAATFDELTIRKKMRVYELEVQKISATNGSLWVSDNCQGDRVEEIKN